MELVCGCGNSDSKILDVWAWNNCVTMTARRDCNGCRRLQRGRPLDVGGTAMEGDNVEEGDDL